MKRVSIVYFAILREQSGLNAETINTSAMTYGDLFAELSERFGFTLPMSLVRASANGAFVEMADEIVDGAEIVFIPPVAGG